MPMIGGGDCIGGCIVKMMAGMTVTEFSFSRFLKPPLKIQAMASSAARQAPGRDKRRRFQSGCLAC